jgi:hypothetical protein
VDQFRAEWENVKRVLEEQIRLLDSPSRMRTVGRDGKDTTANSRERIRRIITELDDLLKAHKGGTPRQR